MRAIELRSEELGRLCQSGTLSRELYIGHCGPIAQASNPIDELATAERLRPPLASTRVHGRKGSVRPRPAP